MRALLSRLGCLLSLLVLGGAPSAQAAGIYWSNLETGAIGSAHLDGSGVNQSFITGGSNPSHVAVAGAYIFWENYWDNGISTIARANLGGTGVNQSFLSFPIGENVSGIATDGTYLYWTNGGTRIGRAYVDGSGVNQSFITTSSDTLFVPLGLAIDQSHIYWTSCDFSQNCDQGDVIGRANIDGTGVIPSFMTGAAPHTFGLEVDSSYIYWADRAGGNVRNAIGRANLDGSGVNTSFIPASYPQDVAVDGTYIYWANFAGTIGRANLDGTGVNQSFITGSSAVSVAVLVPEPGTGLLVIAGLLGFAGVRRCA